MLLQQLLDGRVEGLEVGGWYCIDAPEIVELKRG